MTAAFVDAENVIDCLRETARRIVLPRFRALGDGHIDEKDGGELVTVADLEAEAWLSEKLPELLPGSTVVGEEAAYADPGVLDRLAGDEPVWVVDPIDGTWNFAHGREIFAIIVALAVGGRVEAGWIYEPVSGVLVEGARGAGVRLNGGPVDLARYPHGARYAGTAARHLFEAAERDTETIGEVFRPNCAGHEYVLILSGERAFSAYTRLMPWDHAAGSFLVCEAGGHSALLDAARYDLVRREGCLLSANSHAAWREIQGVLAGD